MENMEERTENCREAKMNQRMTERVNWIETQTYWYLMQLLGVKVEEAREIIPWNIEIIRKVFEYAVAVLNTHGYSVCDPHISTPEYGRQYRCTLSECGCETCNCQDIFMEKERIISNIEDAVALTGMQITGGNRDSVFVREGSMNTDFEIRVIELAG